MATSNVVPIRSGVLSPEKIEQIEFSRETITQAKIEYCDEALEFVVDQLYAQLKAMGFLQERERVNVKDLIHIEHAIQAMMYRNFGLDHAMHEVTENIISIEE